MKTYLLQFGSGNPASKTGLSPTLTVFNGVLPGFGITTPLVAAPGVSEILTTGIYAFQYAPQASMAISFVADGGVSLGAPERYIVGIIDPLQAVDEKIGFQGDSFGTSVSDPSSLYGYAKRGLEDAEGNATFNATTNVWTIQSRGSSATLANKTLINNSGNISKT